MIFEPHDANPRSHQKFLTRAILGVRCRVVMRSTVQLNSQPLFRTEEINYVRPDPVLAPELSSAELPALKPLP